MQVVCEATQTSEIQVSTKDFQFLKAMHLVFLVHCCYLWLFPISTIMVNCFERPSNVRLFHVMSCLFLAYLYYTTSYLVIASCFILLIAKSRSTAEYR